MNFFKGIMPLLSTANIHSLDREGNDTVFSIGINNENLVALNFLKENSQECQNFQILKLLNTSFKALYAVYTINVKLFNYS